MAENKPAAAVDSCFYPDGTLNYAGDDAWAGILNDDPDGPCTSEMPPFSTSRIVAGGPINGGRVQVPPDVRGRRHRGGPLRRRGIRRRPAGATRRDLPDRGVRLLPGGCAQALRRGDPRVAKGRNRRSVSAEPVRLGARSDGRARPAATAS